jgi:hypothetical protein
VDKVNQYSQRMSLIRRAGQVTHSEVRFHDAMERACKCAENYLMYKNLGMYTGGVDACRKTARELLAQWSHEFPEEINEGLKAVVEGTL